MNQTQTDKELIAAVAHSLIVAGLAEDRSGYGHATGEAVAEHLFEAGFLKDPAS